MSLGTILGGRYASFIQFANVAAFPPIGNYGVIYLDKSTNSIYDWNGSVYLALVANSIQTVWGYQDFAAGSITTTTVTLTTNSNGTDAVFGEFQNYADIYRSDNSGYVYTAGFYGIFTGLVEVTAQSGATVTLNKIPDPATPVRIWWVYNGVRPAGYVVPPQNVLDSASVIQLDTLFIPNTDIGVTVQPYNAYLSVINQNLDTAANVTFAELNLSGLVSLY